MQVHIHTIPHEKQVYPTVGDWRFNDAGDLDIYVSKMSDWRYEMLVAVHELVEVLLCKQRDIPQASVDDFDIAFEKIREQFSETIGDQEPGNMVSAPYYHEHQLATSVERLLAVELGVDWDTYDAEVGSL